MPRKIDPEVQQAKEDYISELLKNDPDITMFAITKGLKEHFGSSMAFGKLKDIYLAAGGKQRPRGRRPLDGTTSPGNKVPPPPSGIGNRRSVGRRTSDSTSAKVKQTLGRMPEHLVVVYRGGELRAQDFKTKSDAHDYVQKLMNDGESPTDIGYYGRGSLAVTVDI